MTKVTKADYQSEPGAGDAGGAADPVQAMIVPSVQIPVTVLSRRRGVALVEYLDPVEAGPVRVYMPGQDVNATGDRTGECSTASLARGIPFGEDWAAYITADAVPTPERMRAALRRAGAMTLRPTAGDL